METATDEERARDAPFLPAPEPGSAEALALAAAAATPAGEESKQVEEGEEEEAAPVELKSIPLEFNLKLSTGRK